MKVKKMIVSMLSIVALTACTENIVEMPGTNETNEMNDAKTYNLAISANVGGMTATTYAVDGSANTSSDEGLQASINDAIVFLLNGNSILKSYELTGASLDSLISTQAGQTYQIADIPAITDKVMIVANTLSQPTAGGLMDNASALLSMKSKEEIEKFVFQLNREQSDEANGRGGIYHVTMMGTGFVGADVEYSGSDVVVKSTSLNNTLTKSVAITVKPIVARIEYNGVSAGEGLDTIIVDHIYLNNYYLYPNDSARVSVQYAPQASRYWTETTSTYPSYLTDAIAASEFPEGRCVAYQFFPVPVEGMGYLPHIILKVHGAFSNGGTFKDKFITISNYRVSGIALTKMEPAHVYSITPLTIAVENLTDLPYSDAQGSLNVSVSGWAADDVTPEL